MMKYKKAYFLLGITLCFLASSLWAEEVVSEELRLEGVVMDTARPEESIAMMHGQVFKAGDHDADYLVLHVMPNQVVLKNEKTGKEKIVSLQAQAVVPKIKAAEIVPAKKEEKEESLWEKAQKALNPNQWKNKGYELKAVLDLARIYNAAVNDYNLNKKLTKDIPALVDRKLLPESFRASVRWGYDFYLNPVGTFFGVHADPVSKEAGLRYFYVGQDAVVRGEVGKPAGPNSDKYDYR